MSGDRRCLLAAMCLATAACVFGQSAAKFVPAIDPRGIAATVVTRDELTLHGELLEVQQAGLLVARDNAIVLVSFAAITRGRISFAPRCVGKRTKLRGTLWCREAYKKDPAWKPGQPGALLGGEKRW